MEYREIERNATEWDDDEEVEVYMEIRLYRLG